MLSDIIDAWFNWGWLWMLVGLCGWIVIFIIKES